MKSRKLLCVFLSAVAIFTFAACSKKDDKPSLDLGDADLSYLDHIEIENMDGYNFRMLTRPGMTTDQYVEGEETGDIINDAVYRRNETIKKLTQGLFTYEI